MLSVIPQCFHKSRPSSIIDERRKPLFADKLLAGKGLTDKEKYISEFFPHLHTHDLKIIAEKFKFFFSFRRMFVRSLHNNKKLAIIHHQVKCLYIFLLPARNFCFVYAANIWLAMFVKHNIKLILTAALVGKLILLQFWLISTAC